MEISYIDPTLCWLSEHWPKGEFVVEQNHGLSWCPLHLNLKQAYDSWVVFKELSNGERRATKSFPTTWQWNYTIFTWKIWGTWCLTLEHVVIVALAVGTASLGNSYPILPEMLWSKQPTQLAVDVSPATTEYQQIMEITLGVLMIPYPWKKVVPNEKESVRPQGVWDVSIRPSDSWISRAFIDNHPIGSKQMS